MLLAASMLGSGHDADGDLGDGDLGDADLGDADLGDGELGAEVDALAVDEGPAHGEVAGLAAMFLSLRFWSFFAAFFGLTGVVLDRLELSGTGVTLALSLVMGVVIGAGAARTIRALTRSEVGTVASASDYVGQTGRVLLPVGGEGPGKVRLELRGTTVDVLATSDDGEALAVGETALVLEMKDAVASVTRMPNRVDPSGADSDPSDKGERPT